MIGLGEERETVDRVGAVAAALAERPAAAVADGIDHRQADRVLQLQQAPCDLGPVRPRAGGGDIEVVAAGFGGEARAGVVADEVAELVLLAGELAVGGLFVGKLGSLGHGVCVGFCGGVLCKATGAVAAGPSVSEPSFATGAKQVVRAWLHDLAVGG